MKLSGGKKVAKPKPWTTAERRILEQNLHLPTKELAHLLGCRSVDAINCQKHRLELHRNIGGQRIRGANIYSVYDTKTGAMIIHGTTEQCAKILGVKYHVFGYRARNPASAQRSGIRIVVE